MSKNVGNSDKILNKSDMNPGDGKHKRKDREGKNALHVMKRLLGYVLKNYKFSCIAVVAGNLDSMLNKFTAAKKVRRQDDYYKTGDGKTYP